MSAGYFGLLIPLDQEARVINPKLPITLRSCVCVCVSLCVCLEVEKARNKMCRIETVLISIASHETMVDILKIPSSITDFLLPLPSLSQGLSWSVLYLARSPTQTLTCDGSESCSFFVGCSFSLIFPIRHGNY